MESQQRTKKVLWKYFSSLISIAMGNSNVWEWFKYLENMLYIIYLDNKSTIIIWIFWLSTSFVWNKKIVEFEVLEPESDSAEIWWLMAHSLWGLKLNLNFSSSSLRIMSSSARYERYKGNQVLFWWVHTTCWSSSAEIWANPMFCMLLYVICFLVMVNNWLKALAGVVVAVVQCWCLRGARGFPARSPETAERGVCVCQWQEVTERQAVSPVQWWEPWWHSVGGTVSPELALPCQSSLYWRGLELKHHHFTLQKSVF